MGAAFEWYDGSACIHAALVAAGLPQHLTEWAILDEVESSAKHDCTDWTGFYEDPDEPGTGYFAQGSTSYRDGLQSLYIGDTRKHRRVMVQVTKEQPAYVLA